MSSGYIGHWPLHECRGRANDLSGRGNHGSVVGATQNVAGIGGLPAYDFDGTDDEVDTGTSVSNLIDGYPLAMSAWCRIRKGASTEYNILGEYSGNALIWRMRPDQATNQGELYMDSGYMMDFDITPYVNIGEWHHHAAVVDPGANESRWYVDGVLANTGTVRTLVDDAETLSIGFRGNGTKAQYYADGQICDVRLFDRVPTVAEVEELHAWGSEDHTPPSLHDGSDPGAVARYEFEGDTTDSWGTNDATDNTSAGFVTDGVAGQAKAFDGTDDYLDPPDFGLDSDQSFTWTVWVRHVSDGNYSTVAGKYDGTSKYTYFRLEDTADELTFTAGDTSATYESAYGNHVVAPGLWSHVAAVYDNPNDEMRLYINGALDERVTGATPSSFLISEGVDIGRRAGDAVEYFNGEMDDLRLYSRALESHEVFDVYRWGAPGRDMRDRTVMK